MRFRHPSIAGLGAPLLLLGLAPTPGCGSPSDEAPPAEPALGRTSPDSELGGLFHDFLDGKYDGTGHPLDAEVWEAESNCGAVTGTPEGEGLGVQPGRDLPGVVCQASSKPIGRGRFVFNVHALVLGTSTCEPGEPCTDDEVLSLTVRDESGIVLVSSGVPRSSFTEPLTYRNISVPFTHYGDGGVSLEVIWAGHASARVDYAEVFRSTRRLLVEPPSGLYTIDGWFDVDLLDPPSYAELTVQCGEVERTDTLTDMLVTGEATVEETAFRTTYGIPAAPLLEGCTLPSRVRFKMVTDTWARATARVTVYETEAPCTFEDGKDRVLLTGFEPFPADSTRDNSSEQAVMGFDSAGLGGISVMRLLLPVEFDTAASILSSAIMRCQPDVVVGFGQGRSAVDLETTAYNLKDSSAIAGGAPDNRGVVAGGEAIILDGPGEAQSTLPLNRILEALTADGIEVGLSDDPGRYVCNNLFYRIMAERGGPEHVAGFVHLPRIATVGEEDRARLQTVVHRVVEESVAELHAP